MLPGVLYQGAVRAIGNTLSVRCTLAPVQLDKLFGYQSDEECHLLGGRRGGGIVHPDVLSSGRDTDWLR